MSGGDGRIVVNGEQPADIPARPMGEMPVIVHVAWADGTEEWRAARANRWTATHVFVAWRDDPQDPRSERYEWMRAGDVMRSVCWLVPPEKPATSRPAP
jgi:hypothetical protein